MARVSFPIFLARFEHSVVLVSYTLIALLMSYPLVAQFGDHIPGVDGDVWSYLWAMGWARVAVLNLGVNPFHTDFVFYPLGGATQLLWGTALPGFASIPLQLAFGLVPAFNLIYLAASVLTAYGMYLLGIEILTSDDRRRTTEIRLASFIVGIVFTFGALRLGYGIAFTNLFHTEFIPFYVLFLVRATKHGGWKNAILAGIFFALNVYIDFQIAAFLAILTGLWFLFVVATILLRELRIYSRARDGLVVREEFSKPYARWLITIAVAGILSLPMLGLVLQDFAVEGGNYIRVYPLTYSAERSYDALSYLVPNARSTLYQTVVRRSEGATTLSNADDNSALSPDHQAFLGATVIILALIGAIRFRREMLFWILATLLFALVSLGPVLNFAGNHTNLPMPFALINNIPILNHIRIPMRYGLLVFFGVSLLAGAGAYLLFSWRRWLFVPILALVLVEAAALPYPTLEFRVPRVYQDIAAQPGDFTVVEIPSFHWRHAAKNEVYQAIHQKRILRAYTNRIAPALADYFNLRATPIVVKGLRILEGAEPGEVIQDQIETDRAVLGDTLNFFKARYVILHRDELGEERAAEIDSYLRDGLGAQPFYRDEITTAYQFESAPQNTPPRALDLALNSNLMYLGRGWQIEPLADFEGERGRFIENASSEIYLPEEALAKHTLKLRVYNEGEPTNLIFTLNGQRVSANEIRTGWQTISVTVPPELVSENLNLLQIQNIAPPETIAIGSLEFP